jgi:nicotinamidase-related amidase
MSHLLDPDDSMLLVIDVQERFLGRIDAELGTRVVERIAWLIELAKHLAIPIVATAEEQATMGDTVEELARRLPERSLDKRVFGLADDSGVLPTVEALGRNTAVVVGFETDVCVAHSALGLLDRGYRVAVVTDAVASRGSGHAEGLARMRDTGVVETTTKGIHYEWLRTVERADAARAALTGIVTVPDELVW